MVKTTLYKSLWFLGNRFVPISPGTYNIHKMGAIMMRSARAITTKPFIATFPFRDVQCNQCSFQHLSHTRISCNMEQAHFGIISTRIEMKAKQRVGGHTQLVNTKTLVHLVSKPLNIGETPLQDSSCRCSWPIRFICIHFVQPKSWKQFVLFLSKLCIGHTNSSNIQDSPSSKDPSHWRNGGFGHIDWRPLPEIKTMYNVLMDCGDKGISL